MRWPGEFPACGMESGRTPREEEVIIKKEKTVKTERVLVHETVLQCVHAERTLVVEVPAGVRDHNQVRRIVKEGDLDFGPFPFHAVEGTEYLEPCRLQIIGLANEPADIPWREEVAR